MLKQILSLFVLLSIGLCTQSIENIDLVLQKYEELNQKSLNWGPYRSNLYLGIKPKIPDSILTGLMWFSANDFQGVQDYKHTCEQNHNIEKFGWTRYDPRYGGIEQIIDNDSGLEVTAEFVKSSDGLNWALRVKGNSTNPHSIHSIVFYAGLQDDGELNSNNKYYGKTNNLVNGNVSLKGKSAKLGGEFDIEIVDNKQNVYAKGGTIDFDKTYDPSFPHHVSLNIPNTEIWKAGEVFWSLVKLNIEEMKQISDGTEDFSAAELLQLRNTNKFAGNLHFVQKTFVGDFEFDILFNAAESDEKIEQFMLKEKIENTLSKINNKFVKKFQLQAPFNTDKYVDFAKEILSQLMGGISYFNGDQLVDRNAIVDDIEFSHAHLKGLKEGPYELFTCVPSRPFFPRGFYWDEGFHLLPILDYDSDLTLEIVKSWFSLIDENGWIAREQILGDESRSKVPAEFTVQNPNIANPPTLMLIFSELLDMAKKLHLEQQIDDSKQHVIKTQDLENMLGDLHMEKPELMISYAEDIYSKLQRHYEWFRKTQKGATSDFERHYPNNEEIYRWKGRTKDHCLPSGIDDYPRCEADIGELNVDLISWMGVMTRAMYKIAQLLDKHDDAKLYKGRYDDIVKNIETVHWSENDKTFCDVSLNDDDEDIFECHEGYISIMPFMHKLIPVTDTKKLESILESITDTNKLWCDYGIRSLSKSDLNFHKGEDYWRGHVWININYLVLEALQYYGSQDNIDRELKNKINSTYMKLRENVVNNVYNEYQSTGYAWEQYNEETGSGQRTRHFLGWTSLVILMMKMPKEL